MTRVTIIQPHQARKKTLIKEKQGKSRNVFREKMYDEKVERENDPITKETHISLNTSCVSLYPKSYAHS